MLDALFDFIIWEARYSLSRRRLLFLSQICGVTRLLLATVMTARYASVGK